MIISNTTLLYTYRYLSHNLPFLFFLFLTAPLSLLLPPPPSPPSLPLSQVFASAKETRARELALLFRRGARRFNGGDFPPFPEGTRLAVTQARVIAQLAQKAVEERRQALVVLRQR